MLKAIILAATIVLIIFIFTPAESATFVRNNNNNYQYTTKIPVQSAPAPTVIMTGRYRCAVPRSGGFTNPYVSFTASGVKESQTCVTFMLRDIAVAKGDDELEHALLCKIKIHRKALESIGRSCPTEKKKRKVCDYPTEQCKQSKRFN